MAPTTTFKEYTRIIQATDHTLSLDSDPQYAEPSVSDSSSSDPLKANGNEKDADPQSPAEAKTSKTTEQRTVSTAVTDPIRKKAQMHAYVDVTEVQTFGDRTFRVITSILARKGTAKVEQFSEYSLMLLRLHDNERREIERSLRFNSVTIQGAIRDIIRISNTCNLYGDPIIIRPPYRDLFYHREAIVKAATDVKRDETSRKELALVKSFIFEDHMSALIQEYERLVAVRKINFRLLWCLYPPQHLCILHNQYEAREGVIVESCQLDKEDRSTFNVFYIQMAFDGTSWGVRKGFVAIKLNSETVDISNLNLVPIEFLNVDNVALFQEQLVTRGKKYASLVSRSVDDMHWYYKGRMFTDEEDVRSLHVDSRVMLDRQAYWAHCPEERVRLDWKPRYSDLEESRRTGISLLSKCLIGTGNSEAAQRTSDEADDHLGTVGSRRYDPFAPSSDDSDSDDPWLYRRRRQRSQDLRATKGLKPHSTEIIDSLAADEDYMCCPAVIESYCLVEKIWGIIHVDNIQKIEWRESIFEFLQIEEDTKKLIQALVGRSASTRNQFDDKVPGKGKGLVFLLHGNPGLGKTLTAEGVAEISHRPLFAVTSGELSEDVQRMENAVKQAFWLAERWQAVLLIDEADVFMFRRRSNDSIEGARNAMVTVFLKQVEYYRGFLFLTTNQVQDFDPAFDSRIHLKIHYPDLTPKRRLAIWKDLLQTVKKDDTFTDSAYEELGNKELNGREVKNVIRTANGYAMALGRDTLSLEHVQLVLKVNGMSRAFVNRGASDANLKNSKTHLQPERI